MAILEYGDLFLMVTNFFPSISPNMNILDYYTLYYQQIDTQIGKKVWGD